MSAVDGKVPLLPIAGGLTELSRFDGGAPFEAALAAVPGYVRAELLDVGSGYRGLAAWSHYLGVGSSSSHCVAESSTPDRETFLH
jgi:hypothetical protein